MRINGKIKLMDAGALTVGSLVLWFMVPWVGIVGWVLSAALAFKALLNITNTAPEPAWKIAARMEDKIAPDDFDPADSATHGWSTAHGWRWDDD